MRSFLRSFLKLVHSRVLQLAMIFLLALTTMAVDDTSARFNDIGHKMVCTCGCSQILVECNHVGCPNSPGMIQDLRQKLASGASDASIFNSFAASYGPTVLAAPMRGGFDNAAYIVPITVFLLAIIGTGLVIRLWRSRSITVLAGDPTTSHTDAMRERIRRETEF